MAAATKAARKANELLEVLWTDMLPAVRDTYVESGCSLTEFEQPLESWFGPGSFDALREYLEEL